MSENRVYRPNGINQTIFLFMLLWLIGCAESTAHWLGKLARVFWLAASGGTP